MKKKKIIAFSVGAVFGILLVGLYIASNFMLQFSLNPYEGERTFVEKESLEKMEQNYPGLVAWQDSLRSLDVLRDTFVVNPDGVRLHAFYAAHPDSVPVTQTAICVHGYGNCAIEMFHIARMYYQDLHFNILVPDLHYHGLSEGESIRMGWLDRLDVLQWMKVAEGIFPDAQLVVHGISMGAATTMMVSGEEQTTNVKCFIEDCGYTSVWDEFKSELKNQFSLPAFPLMYTTSWLCKLRYGWSFQEASALEQVKKCKFPMLFIHGDQDTFVPTWMVHPLYEAKSEPKELWIVPGVDTHAWSYRMHPEEYTEKVRAFTQKYMR